MNAPLRRAGRFVEADGGVTVWSVADGRSGRRWRWTIATARGAFNAAHTIETDQDGRFMRLESATSSRLLTLHREADGSTHGNRVTADGIDHLTFAAPSPHLVLAGGGSLGVSVIVRCSRDTERAGVHAIEILDALDVRLTTVSVHDLGRGTWEVRTDAGPRRARLGSDGLPDPDGGESDVWPLETGPGAGLRGQPVDDTVEKGR